MDHVLRIRVVSLKDSAKKNLKHILCYIKKLRQLSSNSDSTTILEPTNSVTTIIRTLNEPFDWNINEGNYCQLLFLTSKSKPRARADIILWFDHLLEYVNDQRHNRETHPELLCSTTIQGNYQLEFYIQQIEGSTSVLPYPTYPAFPSTENCKNYKLSSRQPIQGHLMKLKQFNHPVYCAICQGFIWGLHYQGFECQQCSLVTHKKCYQRIPFWCQKSLLSEPPLETGASRVKIHIPHKFKQHEAPFVRAIVIHNHGHCSHCGSPIFRNAQKCTQCYFIIHEHCKSSIPPMCTFSYDSVAHATPYTEEDPIKTNPITTNKSASEGSGKSYDLTWLDPLPQSEPILLPKFEDFEYIGRVGDGAFAQVYCVRHISSGQYLAIKVADGTYGQARQQLEVEKQILFRYGHENPYMIKAYCAFHQGSKLFLVMELVPGGTLCQKINTTRMNEDEIRFYLAEIICVLQYLHSKKIVYRDLKLEHAVVCSEGHIRLVDYGLGRFLKTHEETCHTYCGTYSYMAPEVRRHATSSSTEGYSYPVDFWALGIMFVQMIYGERVDFSSQMFSNNNEDTSISKNIEEFMKLARRTTEEAYSCLYGLLETDPKRRLGSPTSPHGDIREHPFFKGDRRINWQEIEDGIFKPSSKNPTVEPIGSDTSIYQPLSTVQMDRGGLAKQEWITAGHSTCTPDEDEQYKSFDCINQSLWVKLLQSDASRESIF